MNREKIAKCQAMSPLVTHAGFPCYKYPVYLFSPLQSAQNRSSEHYHYFHVYIAEQYFAGQVKMLNGARLMWAGWVNNGPHKSRSEKWDAVTMTAWRKKGILPSYHHHGENRAILPFQNHWSISIANHDPTSISSTIMCPWHFCDPTDYWDPEMPLTTYSQI